MYRGMAQPAQKVLLATFVCTKVYCTVENIGSQEIQALYAPLKILKSIFAINLYIFCTYMGVKNVLWVYFAVK